MNPDGPAAVCVNAAFDGQIRSFISQETLNELKSLAIRPNILQLSASFSDENFEPFIDLVLKNSRMVVHTIRYFELPRDPKDQMFLDLALTAQADYLISRDRDLLDLMNAFSDEAKEFRQKFRRLKIISPDKFLRVLKKV